MNGRARKRVRPLAAALLVWLAPAAEVAAQISVVPVSELRFGVITAGIPTRIAPTDATGAAQIDVTAKGKITVVVVLPTLLQSPAGHQVPVQFSAADGQYRVGNRAPVAFDPRSPVVINVPGNSTVSITVGGTALPTMTQAPGSYSGAITLQVFPGG